MRVSGKNTTAGSPRTSERRLSERRTRGQEMEEEKMNDVAGLEVVMEDMDYEK
jgi:hypothetical protein